LADELRDRTASLPLEKVTCWLLIDTIAIIGSPAQSPGKS
jgi:hypothetical protein